MQEFFAALQQIKCGVAAQPQNGNEEMGLPAPTLTIGLARNKAALATVCLGCLIPVLGGFGWHLVQKEGPGFSNAFVYGSAFKLMAILFVPAAFWFASALLGRQFVLRIDKNGIFDVRLTERPVPWTALEGVLIYRRAATVYLGLMVNQGLVSAAEAFGPPGFWLFRLNRYAGQVREKVELSINMTLLDASAEDVLSVMRSHKPGLRLLQEQ